MWEELLELKINSFLDEFDEDDILLLKKLNENTPRDIIIRFLKHEKDNSKEDFEVKIKEEKERIEKERIEKERLKIVKKEENALHNAIGNSADLHRICDTLNIDYKGKTDKQIISYLYKEYGNKNEIDRRMREVWFEQIMDEYTSEEILLLKNKKFPTPNTPEDIVRLFVKKFDGNTTRKMINDEIKNGEKRRKTEKEIIENKNIGIQSDKKIAQELKKEEDNEEKEKLTKQKREKITYKNKQLKHLNRKPNEISQKMEKNDEPEDKWKFCPNCGTRVHKLVSKCYKCNYDYDKGKIVKNEEKKEENNWIVIFCIVVIIISFLIILAYGL